MFCDIRLELRSHTYNIANFTGNCTKSSHILAQKCTDVRHLSTTITFSLQNGEYYKGVQKAIAFLKQREK
ncbi:Hypothetical predicted protein [Octopus vulgaris]|uniref:Uncharacterized protein n=1 Tax=Octopus vulgaris TaxID=6645 RepID=A0AA36B3L5_OCTVU|nr:Hypothetical predicted protein [Octopus vulgaris]